MDEPNSITVTGEEWWLKHFGLTEELSWPQEEVDDSSILQIYKNTPWSSLNEGEDIDETGYSKGQTTLGEMVEAPKTNRWNQRCMTNIVRANTDITGYDRETEKETDRSGDAKFDNEDRTKGVSFSPQYDNIPSIDWHPASVGMRGEPCDRRVGAGT